MIRRTLRLGIRLGFLAGIAAALVKLVQGRRSAAQLGRPSDDWATPPTPDPAPRAAPEPELVKPVMLEEIIGKKNAPEPAAPPETAVAPAPPPPTPAVTPSPRPPAPGVHPPPPVPPATAGASVVKKSPSPKPAAKKAGAKLPAPPPEAGTGSSVEKDGPAVRGGTGPSGPDVPPAVEDARKLAAARKAAGVKKPTPKKQS